MGLSTFTQTNYMTDLMETLFSDGGMVDVEIERVRGNHIMVYCVHNRMRLLQIGPLPLKRIGDVVQLDGMRVRLDRP